MSTSLNFERMAKQRYPFINGHNEHNLQMVQMRTDYIAALYDCKIRPAYSVISPWGEFVCSSEPLMPDDTKGWQTVRSHGRSSGKKRQSRAPQQDMDEYEDY
jgi:hypothetical protein